MITTIEKINLSGKWIEFWYKESENNTASRNYDLSSKQGYFWEAVEKADVYTDIINKGIKGLKIEWEKRGPNYEIKRIVVEENIQTLFEKLMGVDNVSYIIKNNWVSFERKPFEIYKRNEIEIKFKEKDNKNDTVIFFSICYNEDTREWLSENCIDYPEIPFPTYAKMIDHVNSIEDDMLNNGFNLPELPKV